jgi:hypothetical protein
MAVGSELEQMVLLQHLHAVLGEMMSGLRTCRLVLFVENFTVVPKTTSERLDR